MQTKAAKVFMSAALLGLALTSTVVAEVAPANIFSDHMVLQQDMPVPIWGTADAGEQVTVKIADQQAAATADADGKWKVILKPIKAGGPLEMTIAGKNMVKVADILVGEVWIASGQSNMQMPVAGVNQRNKEIAEADYPKLRMFTVKQATAAKPLPDVKGHWDVCSPETAGDFSAVGYFFGRELLQQLGTPIGIINTSWGGTPAESWTSRPTLDADPDLKVIVERSDEKVVNYHKQLERYKKAIVEWIDEAIAADTKDQSAGPAPKLPDDPRLSPHRASVLYNAMIAPIIPYAMRGVIWYQGESNAGRAYQYRKLFPTMIENWRKDWGIGDFPFLFVQLANFDTKARTDGTWAELREAQTMTLGLKNTGMAVTVDIGDAKDIHPKNKQDVGKRLALAALANTYGKQIAYSGPMYDSMTIKDNKVHIKFKFDQGLKTSDSQAPKGFIIAGEDKNFVEANAKIEGNMVEVWADDVAKPAAVRYGWNDNPTCTLYNDADLPASPFRTDDWPGLTVDTK